jgi:hypothetical protein
LAHGFSAISLLILDEAAHLRGQPEPWQRFRITAEQCPRISAAFLAEERLAIGDRWWRQEYGVEFVETVDSVFAHEDIMAMLGSTATPLLEMDGGAARPDRPPDSSAAQVALDLAALLSKGAQPLTAM